MFLNNQWVNEKIKREIEKYHVTKEYGKANTTSTMQQIQM